MFGSLSRVLSPLDTAAYHWVITHRWTPLDFPMIVLSHFGAWIWVILGVALALGIRRSHVAAGVYQSAMGIGPSTLLADAVAKPFLGRARPYVVFPDVDVIAGFQRSASFPSTHTAAAFAGAYALSRLFPALNIPI